MKINVESFGDPKELFDEFENDLCTTGSTAFGRPYDDFAEDVRDHFYGSTHGHLIRVDTKIAGFSLYTLMEDHGLYLEGIAVGREYQGLGLGTIALKRGLEYFESVTLAATTRNPATVKLMGGVVRYSSPDIRLGDPLTHHNDDKIQEVLSALAVSRFRPGDSETLPYLVSKYPPGLYGQDPGLEMPLPMIAENPRNAVVVVGIV